MPPLPSSLAAVSDYLVFEINENVPALSGLALPIREESPDLALIGFYTYEGVEWRRVAAVKMIRAGRAEGEFSSLPANVAVLREVR